MSQVTIYLPDDVERELRAAARKAKKSFSASVVELATKKRARKTWPRVFLETFGSWQGPPPEPFQGAASMARCRVWASSLRPR